MAIQPTTDEELQHCIKAGARRRKTERRAESVCYDRATDAIQIVLSDGVKVSLPRNKLEEFRNIPANEMESIRTTPVGYGIKLDAHDISISVQGLMTAVVSPSATITTARQNGARAARAPKQRQAGSIT